MLLVLGIEDNEVGGGFAIDTLERLVGVSPTLAAVMSAAFFIWRFQAREVKVKEAENTYLRSELLRERNRNQELDSKIEMLSDQVRELRDEVHWLRRSVPNEVLEDDTSGT